MLGRAERSHGEYTAGAFGRDPLAAPARGVRAAVSAPTHVAPTSAQRTSGGRERGSRGGDIIDQQHAAMQHRSSVDQLERGTGEAPGAATTRLVTIVAAEELGARWTVEAPGDGSGQQLGLVEPALAAPFERGWRPRDHVDGDPAESAHHLADQPVEARASIGVLEPGHQLAHRPVIGERRPPPVDPGRDRQPRRRADQGQTPVAQRLGPAPARARPREQPPPPPAPPARHGPTLTRPCDSQRGPVEQHPTVSVAPRIRGATLTVGQGSASTGDGRCRAR